MHEMLRTDRKSADMHDRNVHKPADMYEMLRDYQLTCVIEMLLRDVHKSANIHEHYVQSVHKSADMHVAWPGGLYHA